VPIYAPPSGMPPVAPRLSGAASPSGYPPTGSWGTLTVVAGPAQRRAYALAGTGALIGRGEDCAVLLIGDNTVSRRHAIIRNDGRQVTLEDTGSTHGTYLAGQRVGSPIPLHSGDIFQVGQTLLRFD
jgi:thermitase